MTQPINYSNQQIPVYSGVTINVSNPSMNTHPQGYGYQNYNQIQGCGCPVGPQHTCSTPVEVGYMQNPYLPVGGINNGYVQNYPVQNVPTMPENVNNQQGNKSMYPIAGQETLNQIPVQQQAYPPQYYMNNYNYVQNQQANSLPENAVVSTEPATQPLQEVVTETSGNVETVKEESKTPFVADAAQTLPEEVENAPMEEDMSSSKEIIADLDARVAEQKDLEKNGKKTRVIALTNEYIMSLENYLNNPNADIRLMAAKEVLTRLDEDKERYDDAALNALLNKMLQDPNKLVRIAAMSAYAAQLASGNDYTVQLLNKIQQNPNADKDDVLQAADILLKMSTLTEIKYSPVQKSETVEQKAE